MELKYLFNYNQKNAEICVARNYSSRQYGDNYVGSVRTQIPTPIKGKAKRLHKFFFYVTPKCNEEQNIRKYNSLMYSHNDPNGFTEYNVRGFGQFNTKDDRHIKRHYNNPFASVHIYNKRYSVYEKGDRIYIGCFVGSKSRGFNTKYFCTKFDRVTISFHKKTGNFTIRKERKTGIGRKVTFRQNSIRLLLKSMNDIFLYENDDKNLYLNEFKDVITKHLGIKFSEINSVTGRKTYANSVIDKFVKERKIKVPDNYSSLLINYYPTEKYLKKNDRKLIQAILDRYGIKSKYTVKLINKHGFKLKISVLLFFYEIFGNDFPKYMQEFSMEKILASSNFYGNDFIQKEQIGKKYDLIKSEKKAILAIMKDHILIPTSSWGNEVGLTSSLRLIADHLNMIKQLKDFYPDLTITQTTYKTFNEEHIRLSKLVRKIQKETTTELVFRKETIETIEEPIKGFNPVLLKREDEYVEEGETMHHCVSSYVNYDNSIIISLRKEDGSDRITNEYDSRTGDLVQSRSHCNKQPPEEFKKANKILGERVKTLYSKKRLKYVEKKRVPLIINGKEVEVTKPQSRQDERVLDFEDMLF